MQNLAVQSCLVSEKIVEQINIYHIEFYIIRDKTVIAFHISHTFMIFKTEMIHNSFSLMLGLNSRMLNKRNERLGFLSTYNLFSYYIKLDMVYVYLFHYLLCK